MFEALKRWKLARLRRRAETLRTMAAHYRAEWVRLGYEAYYMDQMAEPLRWGRKQNACNWAGHNMRVLESNLRDVEKQLEQLEKQHA